MDTSRVDGVKAPQHRGTPRSHRSSPIFSGSLHVRNWHRDRPSAATSTANLFSPIEPAHLPPNLPRACCLVKPCCFGIATGAARALIFRKALPVCFTVRFVRGVLSRGASAASRRAESRFHGARARRAAERPRPPPARGAAAASAGAALARAARRARTARARGALQKMFIDAAAGRAPGRR
jgi:hypothetical protein